MLAVAKARESSSTLWHLHDPGLGQVDDTRFGNLDRPQRFLRTLRLGGVGLLGLDRESDWTPGLRSVGTSWFFRHGDGRG
ncbi:MAG TPA: hypothetical protein DCQ30_04270 [Acidimicrobiaceae bacterium]|nr:hypothetical protein [Acidimicrobiaceae bacterium]